MKCVLERIFILCILDSLNKKEKKKNLTAEIIWRSLFLVFYFQFFTMYYDIFK